METLFLVECLCGGINAFGGGCGAPRGCYFEPQQAGVRYSSNLDQHSLKEAGLSKQQIEDVESGSVQLRVRQTFSACRDCRSIL